MCVCVRLNPGEKGTFRNAHLLAVGCNTYDFAYTYVGKGCPGRAEHARHVESWPLQHEDNRGRPVNQEDRRGYGYGLSLLACRLILLLRCIACPYFAIMAFAFACCDPYVRSVGVLYRCSMMLAQHSATQDEGIELASHMSCKQTLDSIALFAAVGQSCQTACHLLELCPPFGCLRVVLHCRIATYGPQSN